MNSNSLISASDLTKTYGSGRGTVEVLKGISLQVDEGETIALVGASGAGKSTLMHILGTLDRPSGGQVLYRGDDLFRLSDQQLAGFRNKRIGFVFQFHHLLREFTALENVLMPALIAGRRRSTAEPMARTLLAEVGLAHRLTHKPGELSGGEQQRVAVARALANHPGLILADEPTAALDSVRGRQVMELFAKVAHEQNAAVIVVTHDHRALDVFDRTLEMEDGRLRDGAAAG